MKVLINVATVFIAIIVLAAVFRQDGRSASLRNWRCSTALAVESASTKLTEAEWVPVRDAFLVVPAAVGSRSLTSPHLNGEIGDPLEIAADGSRLTFTLDNTATGHGPTTFFKLDRRS